MLAAGPLELLVLQSTSFCNIDCSYCYLSDRDVARRMSLEVFEKVVRNVAASGLLSAEPALLWHAGEPLTVPISWYREASAILRSGALREARFVQQFQTNGVLIDDRWCELFKDEGAGVGVSLDGPRFLHDRNRLTRRGSGTFDAVMRGVEALDRHGLELRFLAVLTDESLDHPGEIYEFFAGLGARSVGFNLEETAGVNVSRTLESRDVRRRVTEFMRQIDELQRDGRVVIRELASVREILASLTSPDRTAILKNHSLHPLSILTVGHDGSAATFSPELLGSRSARYGDFKLGNLTEVPVRELLESSLFQRAHADLQAGIDLCRRTCRYFPLCGGGVPSNKLTETGTFAVAETKHCLSQIQPVIDVVLARHEKEIGLPPSREG